MTNVELSLNALAEAATTEISKERNPQSIHENITVAQNGGSVAKAARDQLEKQLGRKVISSAKAADYLPPKAKEIEPE